MYRLLIVDDEAYVHEGLRAFPWNRLGIELAGCVEHGYAACRFLENNDVDLLLTDIRMPIMDGLALLEQVSRNHPYIRSVVLTGFEDFDYVRGCMRLGASDYLMKPVSDADLERAFRKLVAEVDEQRRERQKVEALERKTRFQTSVLRRSGLQELLAGPVLPERAEEICLYGEMLLDSVPMRICAIRLDAAPERSEEEKGLVVFAMGNVLEEIWEAKERGYFFIEPRGNLCWLVSTQPEAVRVDETALALAGEVVETFYRIRGLLRTTLSCVVGLPLTGTAGMPQAARKTMEALVDCPEDTVRIAGNQPSTGDTDPHSELSAAGESDRRRANPLVDAALAFVQGNYARSLTLADVAAHVHANATYLSSLFKEATGLNFVRHLTRFRMEEARRLLETTDLKVYEIGERVGYENARYFSEMFKKEYGRTPYEFRSRQEGCP